MLFDFTIFNKEVSNLIDNNTFLDNRKDVLSGTGYSRFVNLENVNVWGSEIYFKRRVGEFVSGKISYTYMVAKGTGSENTQKYNWLTKDTKVPISDYYLSWDQRHTLVVNLDIRKAKKMLEYFPKTNIREGVSKFIEWYKAKQKEGLFDE